MIGGIITVVFVTLKLTGVIDWSWWWVLSPLWIGFIIWGIMSAVGVATAGIFSLAGFISNRRARKREQHNEVIEANRFNKRSKKRIALCVIGVIILFIAAVQSAIIYEYYLYTEWTIYDTAFSILYPLGIYMVLHGSYFWAKEKGRSGWWCLIGLIAPIGYIVLMKLKDRRSVESKSELEQIGTGFTEVQSDNSAVNFCPFCGHKLKENMIYCPSCGKK